MAKKTLRLRFIPKKSATSEAGYSFRLGTRTVKMVQRNRVGCLEPLADPAYDPRKEKHIDCDAKLAERLLATGKFEEVTIVAKKPVEVPRGAQTIDAASGAAERSHEQKLREGYEAMTKADLKAECAEFDINTGGNKAALIARLMDNALGAASDSE